MNEEFEFTTERERMVDTQLASRSIRNPRVLTAMRTIPRHLFVPREHWAYAYADGPLPIGGGQTISQPYIVALMTQLLQLSGDEKVLEVGTGSGYQAAVLGYLAREVHTVEQNDRLASQAREALKQLGFQNVQVHVGDGSQGLPEHAPYEAIIVTAAAPKIPEPLLEQLADQGRLVIPVGRPEQQYLERWWRVGENFDYESLVPVAFVPLLGKYGWRE